MLLITKYNIFRKNNQTRKLDIELLNIVSFTLTITLKYPCTELCQTERDVTWQYTWFYLSLTNAVLFFLISHCTTWNLVCYMYAESSMLHVVGILIWSWYYTLHYCSIYCVEYFMNCILNKFELITH